MTKNEYVFHSVSSLRLTSFAGPYPKPRFCDGTCAAYSHRITSAPIDSTASSNQIALPQDLCIGRPVSSVTRSYVSTRS